MSTNSEAACDHRLSNEANQPSQPRIKAILNSLSNSVVDPNQVESSVSDLINFLDSISNAVASDPDNDDAKNEAFDVLSNVNQFIVTPSIDQAIVDALSFELPKAAARFAGFSDRCLEIADSVVDRFVSMCNPRDMVSILCEALDSHDDATKFSAYYAPLLSGLSKVFLSIKRRHYEQVKVAVPVILQALRTISSEFYDRDEELKGLFERALSIANSIHSVSTKMEGRVNEKLRALVGLFVLQIMALFSFSLNYKVSSSHPLVLRLSTFFPYCGLSYPGLITGSDIEKMTSIVFCEEEDDIMNCLSYIKHGAALSVIWSYNSEAIAAAVKCDMIAVMDELRDDRTKRWQAIGMLKHILDSVSLPWELKKQAIDFLISITSGNISQNFEEEHTDFIPSLFATLQAVQRIIMFASDTSLRKNAFDALKRVLDDIPPPQRFDILQALIINSDSPSMIAILLDILRQEMYTEKCQRNRTDAKTETIENHNTLSAFWTGGVLELVENVLRPPKGGPPPLPDHVDAVLSALNLYRFVLMTESAGKTNYTGVLSKSNLQKAYKEWLLPLRTLVTGIMTDNKSDIDQLAGDTVCTLNPVELVLYRCLELVEEKMKQTPQTFTTPSSIAFQVPTMKNPANY